MKILVDKYYIVLSLVLVISVLSHIANFPCLGYIIVNQRVIPQLRPWIFKYQSNSFLNFAKYLSSLWILQTSIKMVPPSISSVSDDDVSSCMLCCHVHVSRRQPRVQGLISVSFFCISNYTPLLKIDLRLIVII